ncbi:MAG: radical SAM protein [Candidatus Omnitrophota bacterium]
MIIEIIADRTSTAHARDFRAYVKNGWWLASATLAIPWALHAGLFMATGQTLVPIGLIKALTGICLSYWAAFTLIKSRFGKTHPKPLKEPPFSRLLTASIVLSALAYGIFWASGFFKPLSIPGRLCDLLAIQAQLLAFAVFTSEILSSQVNPESPRDRSKTLILVNLPSGGTFIEATSALLRNTPAFFTVLKALTPKDYRIIEYNRIPIWENRFYEDKGLVAISCFTSNSPDAYRLAKEYRRRGATVIMGGPHVTFFPGEALEFCDSVLTGAAESIWDEVIKDYEQKKLKPQYQGYCSPEGMERVHQYLMTAPINVAADFLIINRGCKFNCYFCATQSLLKGVQVEKSLEQSMALITRIASKKKDIVFLDNNLYANPPYAKELFKAMAPLKINWGGSATIDIAHDEETIKLLKDSGCRMLLIGYEIDAGSAEQAKGGKFAIAKNYIALSDKLKKAGILIKGHFIFGFPGDSWQTLWRLWKSSCRILPFMAGLSFLTPVPGAKFFDDSFREQRVINLNWHNYDLCAQVFDHPRLGRPWLLRNAFLPLSVIFFLTGSTIGRILVLLITLKALIKH